MPKLNRIALATCLVLLLAVAACAGRQITIVTPATVEEGAPPDLLPTEEVPETPPAAAAAVDGRTAPGRKVTEQENSAAPVEAEPLLETRSLPGARETAADGGTAQDETKSGENGQAIAAEADSEAQPARQADPASEGSPTSDQQWLLDSLQSLGPAPELLNEAWLNSEALRLADLRGQVVLLDMWTFG